MFQKKKYFEIFQIIQPLKYKNFFGVVLGDFLFICQGQGIPRPGDSETKGTFTVFKSSCNTIPV